MTRCVLTYRPAIPREEEVAAAAEAVVVAAEAAAAAEAGASRRARPLEGAEAEAEVRVASRLRRGKP